MNESLATFLARLSGGLLPQSVSDQASKMFVKRLLKHLFDRLEQLFVQLCWAALTGLFQAFWLLLLQKVAGRAVAVVSPAPSARGSGMSSRRGSGASTPDGGVVDAAEDAAAPPSPPALAALDGEGSSCTSCASTSPTTPPATPRSAVRRASNEFVERFVLSDGGTPGTESTAVGMQITKDKGKMPAALPLPDDRGDEQEECFETPSTTMSPDRQSKPSTSALDSVSLASKASGRDTLKTTKTRLEQVRDSVAAHTRVVERRLAIEAGAENLRRRKKFEKLRGLLVEALHKGARERPVMEGEKRAAGVLSEEDTKVRMINEVPEDADTDQGEKRGRAAMELLR